VFRLSLICCLIIGIWLSPPGTAAAGTHSGKIRVLVVSSYHREYQWSRDTQRGFCDAMLKFGYFDNSDQAAEYTRNDSVETSKVVVRKFWMDAKKKNSRAELAKTARSIRMFARDFKPDIIFLGDDEAAEHLGKSYLDTGTPLVFWGLNDTPVKYGLVETADRPGHNATGVYQSGYYLETLGLLRTLSPGVRTIAVLTDETVSGRTHYKSLEYLARTGKLPVTLAETVVTSDWETWKAEALELQKKVDAFYVVSLGGFKRANGDPVPIREAAAWYASTISIPEATRGHYVREGLLCAADDSGYKQSSEAVSMAHDILEKGMRPATFAARTPSRGNLMVNRARAAKLGITVTEAMGIEELIDGGARP
jgi:putative ABC transport system substrate-binding protein